jgi:hypothetical protein
MTDEEIDESKNLNEHQESHLYYIEEADSFTDDTATDVALTYSDDMIVVDFLKDTGKQAMNEEGVLVGIDHEYKSVSRIRMPYMTAIGLYNSLASIIEQVEPDQEDSDA